MECLGRYRVLGRLASGGMADVLLARTDGIEGFERHVVLKRIRAEYAQDPHFIKMFLDEARLAANLHHQHVVQVNDIGETNGQYFFAMEYLHGEDVRALLAAAAKAKAHVPLGTVVAIGSAAAAGLHYAHERRALDKRPLNIVHCDVSPSNILVGYDGSIKVVDFGIAKAALRRDDGRAGYLKGKASYMSPEQCAGGPVDRRSDVFSLGIVLYELATTTRLFKAPTEAAVMDAILKGRAPLPRVRRPDLPNELAVIIMRALEVDPARRYETADALRLALDRFAAGAGLSTSAAAVAGVMKKMFGERPEPWLELATAARLADAGEGTPGAAGTPGPLSTPGSLGLEPRSSWSEIPGSDATAGTGRVSEVAFSTDRFRHLPVHARSSTAQLPVIPPPVEASDARASASPGPSGAARAPRARRVALVALPVGIAIVGAAIAVVALSGGPSHAPLPVARSAPLAVIPSPSPSPPVSRALATEPTAAEEPARGPGASSSRDPGPGATARPGAAGAARAVATVPQVASGAGRVAPAAPARATAAPAGGAARAVPAPAAQVAAAGSGPSGSAPEPRSDGAPLAGPVLGPALPPAPPPPAALPAPTALPPPPAPPAIAAAPAAPPEAALPSLPQGLINRVAWSYSKDLAKCEGKEALKGEVVVKFLVAPDGRVTTPQITTKMGKPKLAACILRSLMRWKFPPQPPTGAQGTYSLVFQ